MVPVAGVVRVEPVETGCAFQVPPVPRPERPRRPYGNMGVGANPAVGKRGPAAGAAKVTAAAGRARATLVLALAGGRVGVALPRGRVP